MTGASAPGPALRPLAAAALEGTAEDRGGLFEAAAWTRRAVAETLATPGAFGYLAGAGARCDGLVLARAAADECEILWLAVASGRRRRGIGRALLRAALARAAALGAEAAYLEVAEGNAAAVALYRNEGFRASGRRPGYYAAAAAGTAGDALAMRRPLEDSWAPGDPGD